MPAFAGQHASGVGAEAEGDVCAPLQRQQRDAIRAGKRADARVRDHRAVGAEARPNGRVALRGFGDFRDRPDRHLCRQSLPLPDVVVHQLLPVNLAGAGLGKRRGREGLAGSIERFQRAQERGMLFRRGGQCDEHRVLHACRVAPVTMWVRGILRPVGSGAFLPTPEGGGILRRVW